MADPATGPVVVAVETNWVLDVALQQEEVSEELLRYAEAGQVQLFLPSFCIAESIKRFEAMRERWKELERSLGTEKREVHRSPFLRFANAPLDAAIRHLAQVADTAETQFWTLLERVTAVARLLEPTRASVRLTAEIRQFLDLEPGDATVLGAVIAACNAGSCSQFISRDDDFKQQPVRAYMATQGLQHYENALPIIGPIRQKLKS